MDNLLLTIFTSGNFEPHSVHFLFYPVLHWTLIYSNAATFIAYTLIPIVIIYFILKRKDMVFPKIFWLFGAFIVLCGLHYLVHLITFWYALYYLQAIIDVLTVIVSVAAFFALLPVLPLALKLKSPKELEITNLQLAGEVTNRTKTEEELKRKNLEFERINKELVQKNQDLDQMNKVMTGRELAMAELKKENEKLKEGK